MASVPYPSFETVLPNEASSLRAAVGRCRIHPDTLLSEDNDYQAIIDLTIQQADATDEKAKKKLMKQAVARAHEYLERKLGLDVSILEVEVVLNPDHVIRSDGCLASCFLDAGCHTVVINASNLDALDAAKIPRKRLMAHVLNVDDLTETATKVQALCCSISVDITQNITIEHLQTVLESVKDLSIAIQLSPKTAGLSDPELIDMVGKVCRQTTKSKGTICLVDPTCEQLGRSYAACLRSDRSDGLFTTVVCSRTGQALGLVYSSTDSIVAALECGRGVYYSRSRKGLWRKGDTSGHVQQLHRLDVDCDGDALRFTVTQKGGSPEDNTAAAFCHLNTYTCWGPATGLRHLEDMLQDRLKSAPEGSYTARLFNDPELLRNKLVEEAQELAEADTPQHVAEELADVLYFALARAAKAGVSIDDAVAELDRRSRKVTRRKGDSKAYRIAAGQAILDQKESGGQATLDQKVEEKAVLDQKEEEGQVLLDQQEEGQAIQDQIEGLTIIVQNEEGQVELEQNEEGQAIQIQNETNS